MIRASDADRAEIEACLAPLSEYAMFPLCNLAHHGMHGGHPHAVTKHHQGPIADLPETNGLIGAGGHWIGGKQGCAGDTGHIGLSQMQSHGAAGARR